ncbi:MAG TPA: carboxypeptidase-like regulatory domain-containing protein, partial [Bryobacteraceae bacterium]|nr:carboxypeptidase-like regulatory domain-containing protein [Bryobacteraceae bacterium]
MSCKALKFPSTVVTLFLFTVSAYAQLSTTTQVNGAITDSSGAAVPGAVITATNNDTKVTATTQSNADGTYVLTGLAAGTYTLTVAKQGFETYNASDLILHPATVSTINAT